MVSFSASGLGLRVWFPGLDRAGLSAAEATMRGRDRHVAGASRRPTRHFALHTTCGAKVSGAGPGVHMLT